MKSEFDNILPLFDNKTNDYYRTKPIQTLEIRKVFARVLLSDDSELIDEANIAFNWLKDNPRFLIKHPVRDDV